MNPANIDTLHLSQAATKVCRELGATSIDQLAAHLARHGSFQQATSCSIETNAELVSTVIKDLIHRRNEGNDTDAAGTLFDQQLTIDRRIEKKFNQLSKRSRNSLKQHLKAKVNFENIRSTFLNGNSDLLSISGIGRKSSIEIRDFLNDIVHFASDLGVTDLISVHVPERTPRDRRTATSVQPFTSAYSADPWMERFNTVEVFCAIQNRLPSELSENEEERNLGQWLAQNANSPKNSHRKALLLKKLNNEYGRVSPTEQALESLKLFIWQNGRLPDPNRAEEKELAQVYFTANELYSQGKLQGAHKVCFDAIRTLT